MQISDLVSMVPRDDWTGQSFLLLSLLTTSAELGEVHGPLGNSGGLLVKYACLENISVQCLLTTGSGDSMYKRKLSKGERLTTKSYLYRSHCQTKPPRDDSIPDSRSY